MGLDTVELVMRTEEVFGITIPDEIAERIVTVGGLYTVVCERLQLAPLGRPGPETGRSRLPQGTLNLAAIEWNPEDVWATVVAICVDQLGIEEAEARFDARFQDDLGCD